LPPIRVHICRLSGIIDAEHEGDAVTTDVNLIEQYARDRDAEAFAGLVQRHAPMVYGVGLRITGNPADAEDVAQECFLALARQASDVVASPAGWLHAKARTASLNILRRAARRRTHEDRAAAANAASAEEPGWDDIAPHVDQALAELPDELREPLVLHFLEGQTQADVAAALGLNQSTVSRRLDKGVAELRRNLERAGVAVSVVVLASMMSGCAKITAVPAALTASLGKMALAGVGRSAGAAAAMGMATALKLKLLVLLAAGVIAVSAVVAYKAMASPTPRPVDDRTHGRRSKPDANAGRHQGRNCNENGRYHSA
jgi:RNA polymerase sigma factor (sigma-70 family)